ncbi:MAG TPA: extracellular solute-binding protein [Micromonosporaceae bacterium]
MGKYLRGAVPVIVAAFALTACGFSGGSGNSGGGDGTQTISMLVPSYSDATKSIWEGLINDFEAQNPKIKVSLEIQSWDNINDVVRTKVQANKAPDILNIDAYAGFAKDGLLYPADQIASPSTIADFQDSFKQNASLDGTQYGLPLIASTRALFYNKDLFGKAGIAAPPKTWDELLADATRISALGGGVYGYGMPLGKEEAQAETSIWTFGNGGSWTDGKKITVNTAQNTEAVAYMKKVIDAKATEPNPGATDRTPLINVFIQGKIGMIEALPPTIGQIEQKNPALTYAVAPIPTKDGSPVTLGVADHLMVFKNGGDAAKREADKKFIDFFFKVDNYLKFVDKEGFLPTTKSGAEKTTNKDTFQTFLAGLPDAKFYPSNNGAWQATQGAIQSLIGLIAQGKSPDDVLKQIQAKADAAG